MGRRIVVNDTMPSTYTPYRYNCHSFKRIVERATFLVHFRPRLFVDSAKSVNGYARRPGGVPERITFHFVLVLVRYRFNYGENVCERFAYVYFPNR